MQKIRQPEATNEKLRPERFRDGVVNLQGKPSMDRHHRQTADAEGTAAACFVSEAGRSDSNFFAGRFAGTAAAAGALVNL